MKRIDVFYIFALAICLIAIPFCVLDSNGVFDAKAHEYEETEETDAIEKPWNYTVEYRTGGEVKTEEFLVGESVTITADEGTSVTIGLCATRNHSLSEILSTTSFDDNFMSGGKPVDSWYERSLANEWWHVQAGESIIVAINDGDETNPNWVSFKIETVVD